MIGTKPMCYACKHLDRGARGFDEPIRCKAFSAGIPADIYVGGFDHTKPYPDDNGIRFEPVGKET